MSQASALRLLLLSMIWGASFVFYRVAIVELSAPFLAAMRLLLGALFLAALFAVFSKPTNILQNWRIVSLIAVFASALPFLLFAYAAHTVSASILVIMNATSPIWAAVIAVLWTRTLPPAKALLGLVLGLLGVAMIVGLDTHTLSTPGTGWGLLASLGGAACYGLATNMATHMGHNIDSRSYALGCLVLGSAMLAPVVPFTWPQAVPSWPAILSTLGVGVLCSGVAYLIYFRLVQDVGPTSALTVTFLTPVFGVFWGHVVLGEAVGWHTVAGGLTVIVGTGLAAVYGLKKPLPQPAADH
ncbi:MAG TPA: DMT family transporter [Limnobacter sp.]|nr:DMT family transporter [Limnobacter sp.]